MNNFDDHIWAMNKIEEIVAAMEDDKFFALFQAEEQRRIWNEYQDSKRAAGDSGHLPSP